VFCRSWFDLLFFWPLCCLFFLTYCFWLPLWYLLAIVLSVLLDLLLLITSLVSFGHCVVCSSWLTASDYLFGIFWPLCCLFFLTCCFWLPLWYLLAIVLSVLLDLLLLITSLVSFGYCVVCSSWLTASDYLFGIFWPLCCLFFLTCCFWLPLWYLQTLRINQSMLWVTDLVDKH
jgi:hypothetical protein